MKKSKILLFSGVSAIVSVVSFVVALIISYNLPSGAEYEVAQAFGTAEKYDMLYTLQPILTCLFVVFAVAAIALLIVGMVQRAKHKSK